MSESIKENQYTFEELRKFVDSCPQKMVIINIPEKKETFNLFGNIVREEYYVDDCINCSSGKATYKNTFLEFSTTVFKYDILGLELLDNLTLSEQIIYTVLWKEGKLLPLFLQHSYKDSTVLLRLDDDLKNYTSEW